MKSDDFFVSAEGLGRGVRFRIISQPVLQEIADALPAARGVDAHLVLAYE